MACSLPPKLEMLGERVFMSCKWLDKVTIPSTVLSIGVAAFQECSDLSQIELPDKLLEFPNDLFRKCRSLNRLIMPPSVTSMGTGCFAEAGNLEGLVLSPRLTEIPAETFRKSRIRRWQVPKGITKIEQHAFAQCGQLERLTFEAGEGRARCFAAGASAKKKTTAHRFNERKEGRVPTVGSRKKGAAASFCACRCRCSSSPPSPPTPPSLPLHSLRLPEHQVHPRGRLPGQLRALEEG